jgi:2,3-diketo-5-methylthio-1-phosphopentane phosphatase
MLPVGAVLVDFDGTACLHDVAEHLLMAFGDGSWAELDEAWERGEVGAQKTVSAQDALLRADRDTMLEFAMRHCPMDPTFGPFCAWLGEQAVPVTLVSDGFGFYIEPLLRASGISGVTVKTNEQRWDDDDRPAGMRFPNRHPECVGCGTCKMRAVRDARDDHGAVAFIGEGSSDRYGALYADLVFAKDVLPTYCRDAGVPFRDWTDFDDVRHSLESGELPPGPLAPARCPGWMLP